ncbi:MAG: flagellar hook assembly protein FlgD [Jatrophihabitans sp.]|uniref:flagellar hook assembly protein FlgD n=1 Tax=Jatrophihabitans sp. TaxID=1932789 RepID=UPI003F81CD84
MTSPLAAVGATPFAGTPATGVVSSTPPTAGTDGSTTSSMSASLDPQAFLQLLVAQLKYQDPSSPVDTSTFMQQTATLSQVQTMNTMSDSLTSLIQMSQMQAGTEMIGKSITYTDSAGTAHTGVVSGVSTGAGKVTVQVGNVPVAIGSITTITNPTPAA